MGIIVHERHDCRTTFQESTPEIHIGDVGELVVRNVEELGQFQPIRPRLVQHEEEFRVGKHGSCRMALEQIGHILGDTHAAGVILSHPLPEGEQEVCAVFVLEEKVDFIGIHPSPSALGTVADDPVEDTVQHYQHTNGQELLAEITDIVTEDATVGVYIGGLGKSVERAFRKKFDCQCHIRRLRLRLAKEFRMEVLEGGNSAFVAAADVI